MSEFFQSAWALLTNSDANLWRIVWLSLKVSLAAVALGALIGLPLGAWVAITPSPIRGPLTVVLNALMGLPTVVVGVLVYLVLSRAGPLGPLGLLFTPTAMVIAQTILVAPLMAAFSRQIVADAWREYRDTFRSLKVGVAQALPVLLWDCRYSLLVAVLAGLGRALSEVGAVMIVGGNIDGVTRVMTTTIALETSKGDLPLALALGSVLVVIILTINAIASALKHAAERASGEASS